MPQNKPRAETLRQFEAFEYWYWLNPMRTYEAVAKRYGVTEGAVRLWSIKHNWEERAIEMDAKIKKAISEKNQGRALKARENILKTAEVVLAKFGARLLRDPDKRAEAGVTQYEPTATDAERWSKILLLMHGEATDRTDVTLGTGFVAEFLGVITSALRREIPRCCPSCNTALDLSERVGKVLIEASAAFSASANKPYADKIAAITTTAVNADDEADE